MNSVRDSRRYRRMDWRGGAVRPNGFNGIRPATPVLLRWWIRSLVSQHEHSKSIPKALCFYRLVALIDEKAQEAALPSDTGRWTPGGNFQEYV